jgi:hypothetical protein
MCGSTSVSRSRPSSAGRNDGRASDQVNDRLEHQNRRIHQEVTEGDLTKTQAVTLHQDDRQIRTEERRTA